MDDSCGFMRCRVLQYEPGVELFQRKSRELTEEGMESAVERF